MAKHTIYGVGPTIFNSNNGDVTQRPLYVVPSEFGVENPDGTHTYFHGTGLIYDWANHVFVGGTISFIIHYGLNGEPLDEVTGLALPTTRLAAEFFGVKFQTFPIQNAFLSGDDTIDARSRAGGAIVDDTIYGGLGNDYIYGGSGNDTLWGETGNDRIFGGQGNDRLFDGDGNDVLYGEDGIDTLEGYLGDDIFYGGAGNDIITDQFGKNTVYGGDGDDRVTVGTRSVDGTAQSILFGDAGNDELYGGTGVDYVRGGVGDDYLYGAEGNDSLYGDDGADKIYGGSGNDTSWGSTGADNIEGQGGNDTLNGDADNDRISGGDGNDRLSGGAGADVLIGDDRNFVPPGYGRDTLFGDDGDDILCGNSDADTLNGGLGVDTAVYALSTFAELVITKTTTGFSVLSTLEGRDSLIDVERITARDGTYSWDAVSSLWTKTSDVNAAGILGNTALQTISSGTAGDELFIWNNLPGGPPAGFSPDVYYALDGNDRISFAGHFYGTTGPSSPQPHGEAVVFGGNGDDGITVDIRVDVLYGETPVSGQFYFDGQAGNDILAGGNSIDYLLGGSGADVLYGNQGDDVLSGGTGNDTFVFRRESYSGGRQYFSFGNDVITDFVVGADKLQISNAVSSAVTDTTAGLLVTVNFYASLPYEGLRNPATPGALISSSILLQGLHGNYGLGDLVI
jgi:Ca2+-binding RTX toxin-like protein